MAHVIRLASCSVRALALRAAQRGRRRQPAPAVVVNAVELSGDGAIAGNNFNNGVLLAFKEINAAGGILGRQIEVVPLDIQTKPEVAKAARAEGRRAAGLRHDGAGVLGHGPGDHGRHPQCRAADLRRCGGRRASREQGNPYLFRTSLSQAASMPKLARYLKDGLRVESVAMVWVDNAFGRGGQEAMTKALAAQGIEIVADLKTAPEQRDFTEVAAKVRASGAGAAFVYLNEQESADCLRALFDEAYGGWIVGETTLVGQSVIELAGSAANGVRGHVGLTADALVPAVRDFGNRFLAGVQISQRS